MYFKCIHRHIQIKSLTYTAAICRPHTVVTVRTCSIDIHGINCCHSTENSVARWHDAIQYESRQAGGDLRRICVQLVGYVYHVLFSPGNKSPPDVRGDLYLRHKARLLDTKSRYVSLAARALKAFAYVPVERYGPGVCGIADI